MISRPLSFFLCLVSLLISFNCFAWNALGHMVIANIAYQHLQPSVRAKVDAMVLDLAKEYPQITSFTQMAAWPDSLRSQHIETFTHWHYIDVAISDSEPPNKKLVDTDNIVWALGKIQPILKNPHTNRFEKARFLAFLVHLVGDIHQPLHTVSRVSHDHPEGDRGGNLYLLRELDAADFKGLSLHHLWDTGCGTFNGENNPTRIDTLTQMIVALFPQEFFGAETKNPTAADWAKEGINIANASVYTTPENHSPTRIYLDSGKKVAQQRAALAGYRLAFILNTLLSDNATLSDADFEPEQAITE